MERSKLPDEYLKTLSGSELSMGLVGMRVIYEKRDPGLKGYVIQNWFYIISSFVLYTCVVGEVIYIVFALGNFQNFLEITEVAPCIGFCVLGLSKMYAVSSRRTTVQSIVVGLGNNWPQGDLSPQVAQIKQKYMAKLNIFVPQMYILFSVLIWVYNLYPLMETTYHAILGHEVIFEFPYFIWYPYDAYQTHLIFGLTYVTQVWDGCIAAYGNVGPDILLVTLTSHVCQTFEQIAHEMLILLDDCEKDDLAKLSKRLNSLIKRHQVALQYVEDMNLIFSFVILANFIGGSIIICLTGFQVTAIDTKRTIKFLLFLSSSLLEVLLICVYGQKLVETSTGVADAVYNSKWYESDMLLRKRLTYMIIRSQKPAYLTALQFSNVSLGSFTSILKTSWSYFTLLRTVYAEDD